MPSGLIGKDGVPAKAGRLPARALPPQGPRGKAGWPGLCVPRYHAPHPCCSQTPPVPMPLVLSPALGVGDRLGVGDGGGQAPWGGVGMARAPEARFLLDPLEKCW